MLAEYKTARDTIQWLDDNNRLDLRPDETVEELARSSVAPLKLHREALDEILDNCTG
jgi:hypothetical protein